MSSKGKSTRSQFTLDLNKKAEKRYVLNLKVSI